MTGYHPFIRISNSSVVGSNAINAGTTYVALNEILSSVSAQEPEE